jgi:hypothetical protein
MWLLKLDGEIISRVAFYENDLPEYATLSHTWGEDEVTFEDIRRGTGRDKTGYRKLVRCGRLAADDGLKFFWADTCCVDRPSSAQLPEDTKKTFECFRDATRCYVLLADVSWPVGSDPLWFDFEKSRWFTSSWTLQELLASRVLDSSLLKAIESATRNHSHRESATSLAYLFELLRATLYRSSAFSKFSDGHKEGRRYLKKMKSILYSGFSTYICR